MVHIYTLLQKIGENAFNLDLPIVLGIHSIINVNQLNLYVPPHLEEQVQVTHPMDNILDHRPPLVEDTLLKTYMHSNALERSQPSSLVTRASFSLMPNGFLLLF